MLPERATQPLIAAAIISITLNPLLFRLVDPVAKRLSSWLSRERESENTPSPREAGLRAIVIGYGPVSRTLARHWLGVLRGHRRTTSLSSLANARPPRYLRESVGGLPTRSPWNPLISP